MRDVSNYLRVMTWKAGKTINVALIFNYLINICHEYDVF